MEELRTQYSSTAQRRQRQIENCLFECLHHTPYHAIRVSDLCRKVGISRKAFYNYFRDKDDCLMSFMQNNIRDSLLSLSRTLPENCTPLQTFMVLLDTQKEQRDFLDIIVRDGLVGHYLWSSTQYHLKEDSSFLDFLNIPSVKNDTDIMAAVFSALTTLLLQWYFRGFDTPTEEMAKKYLRLIRAPMEALPENPKS